MIANNLAMNISQENVEVESLAFENLMINDENTKKVRVVCISDTHTNTDNLVVPDGDILIHAGDFTFTGQPAETKKFYKFLNDLPHKYKIFVAGNHEITFDNLRYSNLKERFRLKIPQDKLDEIKFSFKNFQKNEIIYLENSYVEVLGLKIYGSPYSPKFHEWAFMASDENLKKIWKEIPSDVDLLITHGPPMFIGDYCDNINSGSLSLLEEVTNRLKPMYHIFGHVHEGYGVFKLKPNNEMNCNTYFINASILNEDYNLVNKPIIFDIKID